MQIVRLQCPACGAGLTVPAGNTSLVCAFCGTKLAIGGSSIAQQAPANTSPVAQAVALPPPSSPSSPTTNTLAELTASTGRGCVAALIAVFVLAPFLSILLMLPILPFIPEDAAGNAQTPDAIALCYGLILFLLPPALGIYAFLYFRRPQYSIGGFFIAPFRRLVRLVRH